MKTKAVHWLKQVKLQGKMITQRGLSYTGVYIDRSEIDALHQKYRSLRESGDLPIDRLLLRLMNWESTDLIPREDLPQQMVDSLGSKLLLSGQTFGVKDPDTHQWVLAIQETTKSHDQQPTGCFNGSNMDDFRRYLISTKIYMGILYNRDILRLVYAPLGDPTVWIEFDMNFMQTKNGRDVLAGLESLLNANRMFNIPTDRRLPNIIQNSIAKP